MAISTAKSSEQRSKLIEIYHYMYAGWHNSLDQMQLDLEFYLDAQHTKEEADRADNIGRTLYVFNKIKRQVRMLHGYEQRNRHILKIQPIGLEDEVVADQHTGVIMQQMAKTGYEAMSQAFQWGPLITGSNMLEAYRDRKGNIRFGKLGYNQFMIDPSTSRQDLSDCQFYMTGRYLSTQTVKSLLPRESDKVKNIRPEGSSSTRWTQGTQYPWRIRGKTRLYEELWEKSTKFENMIVHEQTGRMMPFKDMEQRVGTEIANRMIGEMRDQTGRPLLSKFKQAKDEINLTIYVDNEPVWSGLNPLGIDEFNGVWMIGEYCPENDRSELKLQGFARTLRDPQKARNRRLNQMIDIVETQLNNVRLIKEDALVNKKAAYRSGQGGPLWVKKDFKGGIDSAFKQFAAPSIPAGMFQLLEVLEREETNCGGLNESVFGSDEGNEQIPLGLAKIRTGQALIGQEGFFSNFRNAKQQLGTKLVKINQKALPPSRVTRMLGEPEAPGFRDPNFADYDCVPTEGLLTDTQRALNYEELKTLRKEFPEAQAAIKLKELVKMSPVMNKKELLDDIEKAEQQIAQQQQAQAQARERSMQQMDAIAMAEARTSQARAVEDISDAQLNRAETLEKIQDMRQKSGRESLQLLVELGQSLGILPTGAQNAQQ